MQFSKHIKKIFWVILFFSINFTSWAQNKKYTISGYVKEKGSLESLPGVTVYIPSIDKGIITNGYGFYSITIDAGTYEIIYRYVGFNGIKKTISLNKDIQLDQLLSESTIQLEEVTISAELVEKESKNSQMSLIKVTSKSIQDIPALFGEKDALKALQLLPGVQSGSEGNNALYVRGGGPDQNLFILDDATIYNASHIFGFLSIFNGDALKTIDLYKGGFPARFGGRLSSVVNMGMKDGNKEKTHGKIKVGLISTSGLIEGPINKGKTSYLISARQAHAGFIASALSSTPNESNSAYFYDVNAKINHEFSKTDKIYLSGYFGQDRFTYKETHNQLQLSSSTQSALSWENATTTLRWNHQFSQKMFANTALIYSGYNLTSTDEEKVGKETSTQEFKSDIQDYGAKFDIDFFPNIDHAIKFGVSATSHTFRPNTFTGKNSADSTSTLSKQTLNSIEAAAYIEDDIRLFNRINLNIGFRFSYFKEKTKPYYRPETRIAIGYELPNDLSIKASYAIMNQYIHLLSSSGTGISTDLWVSSTDRIKPQRSEQIAIGAVKDLENHVSISIEGYLKNSTNVISYKDGATFLTVIENGFDGGDGDTEQFSWEDNITTGDATSYGIEFFIKKKKSGKFNGWLGYTLSKTELQFDELNNGEKFLARYDRRHDISLVGIYNLSKDITISATWVFGTGNRFTLPVRSYQSVNIRGMNRGDNVLQYDQRNNFKTDDFHRFDISLQMKKEKRKSTRTWEFGIYNVYNRQNPFFYYADEKFDDNGRLVEGILKKVSLFPILPSVSYILEF